MWTESRPISLSKPHSLVLESRISTFCMWHILTVANSSPSHSENYIPRLLYYEKWITLISSSYRMCSSGGDLFIWSLIYAGGHLMVWVWDGMAGTGWLCMCREVWR